MTPSEIAELRHKRAAEYQKMEDILQRTETRGMSQADAEAFDRIEARFDELDEQILAAEAQADADRGGSGQRNFARGLTDGDRAARLESRSRADRASRIEARDQRPALADGVFLRSGASLAQAFGVESRSAFGEQPFSMGAFIQGLAGTRQLAEDSAEYRAVITGGAGSAGTLVPEAVAAAVLDGVVPASVILRSGAKIVPMSARSVTLPRVASLPVPGYHAEGVADVPDSPPSFDAAVLNARTLAVRFSAAVELLEDASQEAADTLRQVLVAAIASKVDSECLIGDGASGAATGIFNDADIAHTSLAAGLTKYQDLVAAIFAVRGRNLQPNAALMSEREAEFYAGLEDSTGQPLRAPAVVEQLSQYSTTAIPTDQGAATNESFAVVGDMSKFAVGFRPQVGVRVEASPLKGDDLTREFVAFVRFDCVALQPAAFQVVDGILPAA